MTPAELPDITPNLDHGSNAIEAVRIRIDKDEPLADIVRELIELGKQPRATYRILRGLGVPRVEVKAAFGIDTDRARRQSPATSPTGSLNTESQTTQRGPDINTAESAESAGPVDRYASWTPPTPLGLVRTLPSFPVDVLPAWLRDYVEAVATSTQTEPDLAAMLSLAVLSTVLAKKVVVEVRSDWIVPPNIYVLVVLPSGERKSAVFQLIVAPLHTLEREMQEAAKASARDAKLLHKRAAKAAKDAEAALVSADPHDVDDCLREAIRAQSEAENINPSAYPRMLADDVTQEALASLLAEQDGRISILSAEGGIFEILAGRYTEGRPNIEVFLKGHSGDPLSVDRKGRPPEHIAEPAITLGITVQPDVLHGLTNIKGFRGRGLLARILYSQPTSRVGNREIDPPTIPDSARIAYHQAVTTLGRIGS